jgi:hypothetical protein
MRGVMRAAGSSGGLVELDLRSPALEEFSSCIGFSRLASLGSLRLDLMQLDVSELPQSLTSLHVEGLVFIEEPGDSWFGRDNWREHDEPESSREEDDEDDDGGRQGAEGHELRQQEQEQQQQQPEVGQEQRQVQQQQVQQQERPLHPGNPWGNWWLRRKLWCRLPQLLSLDLCMQPYLDLRGSEEQSGYPDRFLALARVQPALLHVTRLAFAVPGLVMDPEADKSLPIWSWEGPKEGPTHLGLRTYMRRACPPVCMMQNCYVLSQLATLRSLVLGEPWGGMAQQLAPLVRLTSLAFEGVEYEALSEDQLGQVVVAAEQLPGLARLAARVPGGCWPEGLAARLRRALPGCRLCEV